MSQKLAYHLVVHAMEARSGMSAMQRFLTSIQSVICGHVDYNRYRCAAERRRRQGAKESSIDRDVRDVFHLDLNPVMRTAYVMRDRWAVAQAYNRYNASAHLAVKTEVQVLQSPSQSPGPLVLRRTVAQDQSDQELCRMGTLLVLEQVFERVERNALSAEVRMPSLVDSADALGVRSSVAGELAGLFDSEGGMTISEAARRLGCHQRTMERQLQRDGTRAEVVRMAARILRVQQRLLGSDNLTSIAHEEGFSDLAHMSRSIKASCGLSPTQLRQMMLGAKPSKAPISTVA